MTSNNKKKMKLSYLLLIPIIGIFLIYTIGIYNTVYIYTGFPEVLSPTVNSSRIRGEVLINKGRLGVLRSTVVDQTIYKRIALETLDGLGILCSHHMTTAARS